MGGATGNHDRRAFTLFEVLITVAIIALVGALIVPALRDDARLRLLAASSILTSDIELAQVMTISQPATPVVITFDPDRNRYWLALDSDPATPIPRADTGAPYLVVFGQGRAASAAGVTFTTAGITGDVLTFNAQGGVEDITGAPCITLTAGAHSTSLDIAVSTGTITQTDG
jgi:prepilin-type N-terminal cleavage/methylation domain-containing protein